MFVAGLTELNRGFRLDVLNTPFFKTQACHRQLRYFGFVAKISGACTAPSSHSSHATNPTIEAMIQFCAKTSPLEGP